MIAWHGSPVLFDRFDAAKIGSQWRHGGANGYGIYLTDDRAAAETFAAPAWLGRDNKGFLYEVEAPDGEYVNCDWLCSDQPEPVRSILLDGINGLGDGPTSRFWKFVINDAPQMAGYYSQIGKLLYFSRLNGTPLEPGIAACGYVGCKKWREGGSEFAVFDPSDLRILSVAEHERAN
jgi:hypothetical protein